MYKLTVFVPDENLEQLKSALFASGAGIIGDYTECCWQVRGLGQFRPLVGSNPHIGQHQVLETVNEWRLEMLVDDKALVKVMDALKHTHPYETPAYDVIKIIDI